MALASIYLFIFSTKFDYRIIYNLFFRLFAVQTFLFRRNVFILSIFIDIMVRGVIVLVLLVVLSSSVLAFGDARNNNAQTLTSTTINGHTIELKHVNLVQSEDICVDFGGVFPVFFSKQSQAIMIDEIPGSTFSGSDAFSEQFDQWDNWEHCPRLDNPGKNRENCVDVLSDFYQEGDELKINVRNYGGDCDPDTCNNCVNPWDVTETLSIPFPAAGECVVGSPCCTPQGTFADATAVCNVGLQENAGCSVGSCNAGVKYRYGTQFCSGNTAECDGLIEWSDFGVCSDPPVIRPEVCDELDNNCNVLIDEGFDLVEGSVCSVDNNACYDGTPLNTCSVTKPYYCQPATDGSWAGNLIQDSQTCGCSEGLQLLSWGGCGLFLPSPVIDTLEVSPRGVQLGQSITFRVLVEDTSPLLSVQVYYRQYPTSTDYTQVSLDPADYIITLPVAFHPAGTVPACDTCTGLVDVYEGVLPQGFINQGTYYFMVRVIGQANQATDKVVIRTKGRVSAISIPQGGNACTTLYESGDPNSKMNIFFLNDVDNEASQIVYDDITVMAKDRMRGIPPIPENNLQDKFNFYRNNLPIDFDCPITYYPNNPLPNCDNLQQVSAALLCNKPVKLSNTRDFFSDKIVTFTSRIIGGPGFGFTAGLNEMYSTPQFTSIHYRDLSGVDYTFNPPNPMWSDVVLHELGHSFGFPHIDVYKNASYDYIRLDCDPPRQNIMCSDGGVSSTISARRYRYNTSLQWRIGCQQRNDIPPGFPAPVNDFCNDQYNSNTEYLIGELSQIP